MESADNLSTQGATNSSRRKAIDQLRELARVAEFPLSVRLSQRKLAEVLQFTCAGMVVSIVLEPVGL
jgi:hypothetical protein